MSNPKKKESNSKIDLDKVGPLLIKSAKKGTVIKGKVLSYSMEPLLKKGMWLEIKRTDFRQIGIGDIICYQLKKKIEGVKKPRLYVHRVISIDRENQAVITKGDNMTKRDRPVKKDQIIGKVVSFKFKNKDYYLDSFSFKLLNWLFTAYSIIASYFSFTQKIPKGRKTLLKLFYGY